jgi:hypothetical protein
MVSVVWNNPSLGGLDEPSPLECNPVYGLYYGYDWKSNDYTWFLNNGMFKDRHGFEKHVSGLLSKTDPGAKVIWYPTLIQLIQLFEEDLSDKRFSPMDVTLAMSFLKKFMSYKFNKIWDNTKKMWVDSGW